MIKKKWSYLDLWELANDLECIDLSVLDTPTEEDKLSYKRLIRYKNLLDGDALDDAISRNASDAKNVVKRYTLINNMVRNTLKELKNA